MRFFGIKASVFILVLVTSAGCGEDQQKVTHEASVDLDSLLTIHPDSVPLLLQKGRELVENYDYNSAMNYTARAFRLDSNNIEARHLYAEVLNNRASRSVKDVALAQKHYHYILKEQPENTKALVGLATTYSFQRNYDKSFKYINDALRIDKKYRDGYVAKALNYRLQIIEIENELNKLRADEKNQINQLTALIKKKWDLMKSSYETAIRQDPEFYVAYFELGKIYMMEENKICVEYFESAHNLMPEDPMIKYYLAYSKQHYGQVENAEIMYREMAQDPNPEVSSLALFQLGHINQFIDQDLDSAIYYYSSAIQTKPDYVEAHHNMGMCYDLQGQKSLALRKFGEALKYDPEFRLSREYADSIR